MLFEPVLSLQVAKPAGASPLIMAEEILAHIKYLSSDEMEGRMAGTRGAELAVRYIEDKFKAIGLEPVWQGGYRQSFEFTSGAVFEKESSVTFDIGAQRLGLRMGEDFYPIGAGEGASGGLVFAGYGITAPDQNHDDYANVDVKGKVVIVFRGSPFGNDPKDPLYGYSSILSKIVNAREKGVVGILFVTPIYMGEKKEQLRSVFVPGFDDAILPAVVLKREVAQRVLRGHSLKELEEGRVGSFPIEDAKVHIEIRARRLRSQASNVGGLLRAPANPKSDEYIIVGAHYDHIGFGENGSRAMGGGRAIHNGADDNASGIAGLLELAEYFASSRESLRRNILLVAFGAEELGVLGSSHFVKNPPFPLEKVVAMINMDMIGRLREGKLTVLGTGSSPEWSRLLNIANSSLKLTLLTKDSGFAPSDQTPFLAKGIPAIQFFTGVHTDYHTPGDDWNKINPRGEAEVLIVIARLIEELNALDKPIVFANTQAQAGSGITRFSVYLGTIPDYSADGEGVLLMGVKPGSPSDEAGLKGGDLIVGFGGRKIRDIYDYVEALKAAKPGVPTNITVVRGGSTLSFVVVPRGSGVK